MDQAFLGKKSALAGMHSLLDSQNSTISNWKKSLESLTQKRQGLEAYRTPTRGGDLVNELEQNHAQHLKNLDILESPEKRAERMINEFQIQVAGLRAPEPNDPDILGTGSRPWQKPTQEKKAGTELHALESVLLDIQTAAEELALKIHKEPPCISHGFVDDIEALIRQNVILKKETERTSIEMLGLQEEVSKLREDATKNQTAYAALQKRLAEVTNERNELSERLRHGLSSQEKDEYAREIQRLNRTKKEFTSKFGRMSDQHSEQQARIIMLENEIERLKTVNVVQEEEFKGHVGRLVRDKKALHNLNEKMNKSVILQNKFNTKIKQAQDNPAVGADDDF